MKTTAFLLFYVITFSILECKVLPKYLSIPCPKSTNNYEKCNEEVFRQWGPYLINGVKEIGFPKLSPLHIPLLMVNRSLGNMVTIRAVLKNIKIDGFETTSMKEFHFDPHDYSGNLHLHISRLVASMDYDVRGNLLGVNIGNVGHFTGDANDIELLFDFQLKLVDKLGIEYFEFHNFNGNSTIGDGNIKMKSENPEFQPIADLITNFFNENPKRVIDAVQPIYAETVGYFYKGLAEQVLRFLPAHEIVPA